MAEIEDLVYMLDGAGIEQDLDLETLIDATGWLAQALQEEVPSSLLEAGPFSPEMPG